MVQETSGPRFSLFQLRVMLEFDVLVDQDKLAVTLIHAIMGGVIR